MPIAVRRAAEESYCEQIIMDHLGLRLNNAPADSWRKGVVSWTWRIKVLMHLETELMGPCANARKMKQSTSLPVTCTIR
ncbi:hypothetical protein ACNKHM_14815 [Shigella sonnei]